MWRKLNTLLPEARKHGARYTIEDLRIEIRAIRNRGKWLSADTNRDDTAVETELEKMENLKIFFRWVENTLYPLIAPTPPTFYYLISAN